MRTIRNQRAARAVAILVAVALWPFPLRAQSVHSPLLESGFNQLYSLQFAAGRQTFQSYERRNPNDALGPAAEAASYLFEEFNRQGVLTSKFFLDDKRFLGGTEHPADPTLRAGFLDAVDRARRLAKTSLNRNPSDTDALLALTFCAGMQSDFEALIEKHQLEGLHYMREAQDTAKKLLAVDPKAADAYVATGSADYIIGSMPGYKRAFLWFGGVHGDRQRGMDQLRIAATQGDYLRPFAKIMLALSSLREGDAVQSRDLFAELVREFPENILFPRELAIATARVKGARTCGVGKTPC
jgi:hypothetical protein